MKQTAQTTDFIFKSELLQNTAQMIKDAGYKVFYSVWSHEQNAKPSYFHFTDGTKIGYCQEASYFGGMTFSTVHKPCKECGTGFGLNENGLFEPTIKDAEKAFVIAPNWAKSNDVKAVKKYTSWGEYVSKNSMPKYIEF